MGAPDEDVPRCAVALGERRAEAGRDPPHGSRPRSEPSRRGSRAPANRGSSDRSRPRPAQSRCARRADLDESDGAGEYRLDDGLVRPPAADHPCARSPGHRRARSGRRGDRLPDLARARPSWQAEAHGGAPPVAFALANTALELIAPSGRGPMTERLGAALDAQGEGLASIAFAVPDIERAHRRLARLGLDPEPVAGGESVDAGGGRRRWRRTRAAAAATHGVRIFLMEQEALPPSPARRRAGGGDRAGPRGDPHAGSRAGGRPLRRAPRARSASRPLERRLGRAAALLPLRRPHRGGRARPEGGRPGRAGSPVGTLLARARHRGGARPAPGGGARRLGGAAGRKPGTRVFTVRDRTCSVPTLLLDRGEAAPDEA